MLRHLKSIIYVLVCCACTAQTVYGNNNASDKTKKRVALKKYVAQYYPYQLTYPQKKNRKSLSQFGYGLFLVQAPLYPISQFINPHNFGSHSYSKPGRKERNGALYTCRGGFVDFAHMRCAADWTVYFAFKILNDTNDLQIPGDASTMHIHFNKANQLPIEDIVALAQRLAYERLTWHEIASWYYHPPNHVIREQQSTFTPEDTYSNFLGTVVGQKVALRILRDREKLPYEQIASEEVEKMISVLQPVNSKRDSRHAYDIVDRCKQLKLPETKRNKDIWYDSGIVFMDYRYCFKRNIDIGPKIEPWLVPASESVGCNTQIEPHVLSVPQKTTTGNPLSDFYTFTIIPEHSLFYSNKKGKQLHIPFPTFTTTTIQQVVMHVAKDMEQTLLQGFDKRDKHDPVPAFKKIKRVWFKARKPRGAESLNQPNQQASF
ncbi:MAG TPA: DUF4056 domain-containing protein [Chitinophagales bacterium]|nr:DUF4056 domain-containing protein [Chitinophagales bacterium]